MPTFYNIDTAQQALIEQIAASTDAGEAAEAQRLYDELQVEKDQKIWGICAYICNTEADIDAYAAEEKRLKEERQAMEKRIEKLKNFLSQVVPPGEKWSSGTHKIGWRKSKRLIIDDVKPHPLFTKIIEEHDKEAIKQHIEGGGSLEFARIAEFQNIQVK